MDLMEGVFAPAKARRRSMAALFAAVASMNTAMVGAATAGTLIASHSAGPGWSGLPNAAGVLGTALGALASGVLMSRRGPRHALMTLYGIAASGALVAFAAAVTTSLPGLLIGMALLGLGNGGAQLSRYAAADLYPPDRKGFGLSVIVWAGTVGALAGPALIAPAADAAERLLLPGLSGPIAASALVTALALAVTALLPRAGTALLPEGTALPPAGSAPGAERPPGLSPSMVGAALRRPEVRTPLVAMMAAQIAMVAVMTMTPLQLHRHGHGLDVVGWVLSAHMVGMFALAPLSGRIVDRRGGRVTIGCGVGVLAVAAVTAMAAPTAHASGLPVALFLLGYGWNLVIVGGSGLLSRDLAAEERTRLQGVVDALVWSASAIGSLSAGQLFAGGGYPLVAALAGGLAVAPLVLLVRRR